MTPEYDYEPVPGLPGHLPANERMLWQGSPDWQAVARDILHIRGVAIYFVLIMAWAGISVGRHDGMLKGYVAAAWILPVALAAMGIICGLALAIARTTIYTVTDKRAVLRFGIALPKAVNLPFSKVEGVSLRVERDGTGNIAFDIGDRPALGYFLMWPHARPYWLSRTQPMLRGIRDPHAVAELLREPLARTMAPAITASVAAGVPIERPAATVRPSLGSASAGPLMGNPAVAQAEH